MIIISEIVNKDVNGNPLPCKMYFDQYLLETLKDSNQAIKKGWDIITLLVGYEGDGKTTLGVQMALYWDYTMSIDRIVFSAQQFEDVVDNCPKESSVLWDEADDLSGAWSSEMVLAIKKKMKRIRRKRLKIILCTPTFHDLNKYFAISRTRFMVHVYAKGLTRGHFRAFGRERKKKLYIHGKKEMDLGATNADFNGRFEDIPDNFPIDMSEDGEYDIKKEKSTESLIETKDPKKMVRNRELDLLVKLDKAIKEWDLSVTREFHSQVFGVDIQTITSWRREKAAEREPTPDYITNAEGKND